MNEKQNKSLDTMVAELEAEAGKSLLSVVLHGAEVRGDHFEAAHDLFLLIVMKDLEPGTLCKLQEPIGRWLKKGNPMPRFFTPETIADSADTFPMELLDIRSHKKVLSGEDVFAQVEVATHHLRLQCERELREKLMRVQEAYVEARGRKADLSRLLIDSYLAFLDIFRGCLRLLGHEVPARATEVVASLCEVANLQPEPFAQVDALARGDASNSQSGDLEQLFASYYQQLKKAVHVIDRLEEESS